MHSLFFYAKIIRLIINSEKIAIEENSIADGRRSRILSNIQTN